jgi:hypothetical protein
MKNFGLLTLMATICVAIFIVFMAVRPAPAQSIFSAGGGGFAPAHGSVDPAYRPRPVPHPADSRCSAYDIACNTPERKRILDEAGIKKGQKR